MAERGLFADLLYAVTVGATLPRINAAVLHADSPVLWGIGLLLVVFLEDFYLYHVRVLPYLPDPHNWRGFMLSVLIVGTWYLTQAAFPTNSALFLAGFAMFFIMRIGGSLLYRTSARESLQEMIFVVPIAAAIGLLILEVNGNRLLAGHPGRLLWVLFPSWLVSVAAWWFIDQAPPAIPGSASAGS